MRFLSKLQTTISCKLPEINTCMVIMSLKLTHITSLYGSTHKAAHFYWLTTELVRYFTVLVTCNYEKDIIQVVENFPGVFLYRHGPDYQNGHLYVSWGILDSF